MVLTAPAVFALSVSSVAKLNASNLKGTVTLNPLAPSSMNCCAVCLKLSIGASIFS